MTDSELFEKALEARKQAYVPYSKFAVGAALLTQNGEVFTGCNVENAAYPACLCAERVAISKAVSEGYRKFAKMAVVGGKEELVVCFPCGECRQVLSEFVSNSFEVIVGTEKENLKVFSMAELLPRSFEKDVLFGGDKK